MIQTQNSPTVSGSGKKIPESVLVVLFAQDGRFLLIERADKAGYWQSVTGSLDFNDEPPLSAAVRELSEETGVVAQPDPAAPALAELTAVELFTPFQVKAWPHQVQYEIFEHWRHKYEPHVTHNTEYWFHVCVPINHVPVLSAREHVGYEWVTAQRAIERCFSPNNAQAIQRLSAAIERVTIP